MADGVGHDRFISNSLKNYKYGSRILLCITAV